MYIYHDRCDITNYVKSCKKFNERAETANFTDFLWKWSIMEQNYANTNAFFSVAKTNYGAIHTVVQKNFLFEKHGNQGYQISHSVYQV